MTPETCIVVPTYWTRPGGESRSGDAVYDHPTPLDEPGTLEPLLESLARLDTSGFYLLLLVAVTAEDAAAGAERRVRELAANQPSLTTLVFGPSQLAWLRSRLIELRAGQTASACGLREYARIRNLQLALPHALHSRAIAALDDDEIVTDPGFLDKVTTTLGTRVDGLSVDGLSGYYEQREGGIRLQANPAEAGSTNLFDRKASIMNAATERLEAQSGNLVETPFCFGGNMHWTARLAAAVGFDAGITRGEDIDYLINARLAGMRFFLRRDLRVLHCPPEGGSYRDLSLSKLEQDVIRFVYEREKLELCAGQAGLRPLNAADLMPYPGEFLTGDLEADAAAALGAAGYRGDASRFVSGVRRDARVRAAGYLEFRRAWPTMMHAVYEDRQIGDRLASLITGGRGG